MFKAMYDINPYQIKNQDVKPKPEPEFFTDIAASQDRIFRDTLIGPFNPDDLVEKKSLKKYEEMRKDDQIKACQKAKILARLSTGYRIDPGDENNPQSVEMAEFITDQLDEIDGTFTNKLKSILTARDYGFSITEKIYKLIETGRWEGRIGLKDLKTKEPFGYEFMTDEFDNLKGITVNDVFSDNTLNVGSPQNPFPPKKFVIYSANKEFGNWYGQSDLRETYTAWFSKKAIIAFYNIYLEKYASPTVLAKYPEIYRNNSDVLNILDSLLKNFQANTGTRIPSDVEISLLEATRRGDPAYKEAIEHYNKAISRALLCPDMSIFDGDKGGSFALSKQRFSLFMLLLKEMGIEIEDVVMNDQIIDQLILFNWGVVDAKLIPRFVFEPLEQEDTKLKSEIIKIMVETGVVNSKEEWIREFINIPDKPQEIKDEEEKPQDDDDVVEPDDKEENPFELKTFDLRRQPTEFESKVDFVKLDKTMDSYTDFMKRDLTEVVKMWQTQIMKQAEKIFKSQSAADVNKMFIRNVSEFKRVLTQWLTKIHLDSKFSEMNLLDDSGLDIETKKKPIPRRLAFKFSEFTLFPEFDPWEPLPISDAIVFFNTKRLARITDTDGKKQLVTLAKNEELQFYDKRAFAIAGVESEFILGSSKNILMTQLKSGDTKKAIKDLNTLFSKYIETGELKDGKLLSPSRLDTIVRTNSNEALNKGRMDLYNDPDITEFVPWVQVAAVRDDRTTEYCLGLDGKVFKKSEAPLFPAHHNCFVAGTRITFRDKKGYGSCGKNTGRPIEKMRLGDFVYTHNGNWKEVVQLHTSVYNGILVDLKLQDGRHIKCTENHPILTDNGWIKAGRLTGSEDIITIDNIKAKAQWVNDDDRRKKASVFAKNNLAGRREKTGKYKKCDNVKCDNLVFQRPSRQKVGKERYCSKKCLIDSGDLAHKLSEHPLWLGGKSFEPYGIEFNKKLKEEIKQRDNFRCQECMVGSRESRLCVHHVDYNKENNEKDNLVTLCAKCHVKTNYDRNQWQNYFKAMIHENKKYKEENVSRVCI